MQQRITTPGPEEIWTIYNARMAEILSSRDVPLDTVGNVLIPYEGRCIKARGHDPHAETLLLSPEPPTLMPEQPPLLPPCRQQKLVPRAAISAPSTPSNKPAHIDKVQDGAEIPVAAGQADWRRTRSNLKSQLAEALLAPVKFGSVKGVARLSQRNKRALKLDNMPELAAESQKEPKRTRTFQGIKSDEEKRLIVRYMQEEINDGNVTEKKWSNIARKLKDHGLERSQWSVKAWWSRYGRLETGIDERQKPNERRLVTSKQDPEERRKARELKRRDNCQKKGPRPRNAQTTSQLQKPGRAAGGYEVGNRDCDDDNDHE
ncbi:MAG: hypothetical protein Q9173_000028 [Seirophora scorigena]